MGPQDQSSLLKLPKELRLAIYEYALETTTYTLIGTHAVNQKNLADWPIHPGIVRASSLLREEALSIYFSQTHFHIALQSHNGMKMALAWINTNSLSCPRAFNHLRHIKFVVGAGIYDRPEEFVIDLQLRQITSSRTQMPQRTLMFGEGICGHPANHFLKYKLAGMPDRRSERFDMAEWLEPVVRTMFVEFTLEDADGFML
jgi:hypothetical protein